MARQEVRLPTISFKSKAEATTFFKGILTHYQDGEEVDAEDDCLLFELIQRHPDASQKIGVGIKRFYRDRSPIHPSSCFHLERVDGTTTDFSYTKCISSTSATLEQQFYEACRFAVSQDLINRKSRLFKESGGVIPCCITGRLVSIQEADYRHTTPKFREIVAGFVQEYQLTMSPSLITHGHDLQYVVRLADKQMELLFRRHHSAKATLAVFSRY